MLCDFLLVLTAATVLEYEAISTRLFGGGDNVRRFQTSVALGSLKTGFHIPLQEHALHWMDIQ